MPPKISVIIPVYNRADDITRAIQTVMAQTFRDFEMIVVDDASTDGGKTIAAVETHIALHPDKIRLIKHDVNKGVGGARNTGIAAAAGEYIALLDSDDEWHADKLDVQLNALVAAKHRLMICLCDYLSIPKTGKKHVITVRPSKKSDLNMSILGGTLYNIGTTLLAHRSVFDPPYRFDESYVTVAEDYDWLIRHMLRGGKSMATHAVLATYHSEPLKPYKNHIEYIHRLYTQHAADIQKTLGFEASRYFLGGKNVHLLYVARQTNNILLQGYYFFMKAVIPPNFFKRAINYIANRLPFKTTS